MHVFNRFDAAVCIFQRSRPMVGTTRSETKNYLLLNKNGSANQISIHIYISCWCIYKPLNMSFAYVHASNYVRKFSSFLYMMVGWMRTRGAASSLQVCVHFHFKNLNNISFHNIQIFRYTEFFLLFWLGDDKFPPINLSYLYILYNVVHSICAPVVASATHEKLIICIFSDHLQCGKV